MLSCHIHVREILCSNECSYTRGPIVNAAARVAMLLSSKVPNLTPSLATLCTNAKIIQKAASENRLIIDRKPCKVGCRNRYFLLRCHQFCTSCSSVRAKSQQISRSNLDLHCLARSSAKLIRIANEKQGDLLINLNPVFGNN
jgi:hypothetical protein